MKKNKDNTITLSNKVITRPFFVSMLVIILLFFATLTYINTNGTKTITENQIAQIEELIIQSKKDYIQTAVSRTINDIKLDKELLQKEINIEDPNFKELLKKRASERIRKTILKDSGYIWVNEIIDYNGGDDYAIRKIHPNLPKIEGSLLSTNTTDIKGNMPYLTELNGIKKNGQLFFKYWLKKHNSNKISQKLTYAELCKELDWIIATGVYLDDVDSLISEEINKGKAVINKQIMIATIMIIIAVIIAFITVISFRSRIQKTINFFTNQVQQRENTLNLFNENLEKVIEKRTSQLKESEQRYKSLFKNNQSVMMLIDPENGNILDVNKAAVEFYGYSIEEITNMKINQINILEDSNIKKAIDKTLQSNQSYFTFKHKLANNEIKDVEVYTERLQIRGRDLLYSIIHDITQLRKTQQELLIAKDKAEESDKLKSAFLANMSHEIRTPMNSILGFSSLLASPDNSPEKAKQFIDIIFNSGEQLMTIINDIVDISKIESNQLNITLSSISINKTLQHIFEVLQKNASDRGKKKLNLNLILPPNNLDYTIETDEIRLIQICNNLLNNSLKFTETGKIEFGYHEIHSDNKTFLEFYVKDTGCGIPESQFESIFERFSQTPEDSFKEGNGLGLSITKGLVLLLGGTIHLDSQLNKGSTFYFTIPFNSASVVSNKQELSEPENKIYNFSGIKILIAEDDISSFSFLEEILTETHADILHASNGLDLLNSLPEINPDLVLLDINMPIMNGYQVIKEIRKTNSDLTVIAQTAYAMPEEKNRILKAGCNDYLAKPINKQELFKVLFKHINKTKNYF